MRDRNPGQGPRDPRFAGLGLKFQKSGTQNQKIWDFEPGPGLKIEKSGIGGWDRDSDLRDEGFRDSTLGLNFVPGTKEFRDSVPVTESFPGLSPGD